MVPVTPLEIARRMAQLGQEADAVKAYTLAAEDDLSPGEHLECAAYLLEHGGDYKISYTTFVQLYNAGYFREDILPIMTRVFYEPNARLLKKRYERNVRLLSKYPYLFQKDFPSFEELTLIFFPYDDHSGYVPFDTVANEFRGFVNVKDPIVSRNFFRDLEKPILADDVYSQYELEYLVDNVRPSEWVGRENHIYLHYTKWEDFCSWLAVLNMKPLLERNKIVFLIGDELRQYPIDFKDRFGIDYSEYPVKPVGIREINKLIWHTQLSSHNGGDFFNEIMDDHPNLLWFSSTLLSTVNQVIDEYTKELAEADQLRRDSTVHVELNRPCAEELLQLNHRTKKDIFCAVYLGNQQFNKNRDLASRIVPAIFFQPHFGKMDFSISIDGNGNAVINNSAFDEIEESGYLTEFKYIKTFTPMRRFTTSYGAALKYTINESYKKNMEQKVKSVLLDQLTETILNQSYLRNPEERPYRDATIVRFEDGKLNSHATFSRLAAFLDIPYTDSMTYCSINGEHDVASMEGNAVGFDASTVYRTYDEYADDAARILIEYYKRSAYLFYGYSFQYYDEKTMDKEKIGQLARQCDKLRRMMAETWKKSIGETMREHNIAIDENKFEESLRIFLDEFDDNRESVLLRLSKNLRFVNKRGQPLEFTPMLEPDPDLLEQPLYH